MRRNRNRYKREHFATQEQYDDYRRRLSDAQLKWLKKREANDPEHRERRLARQRIYNRYYKYGDNRPFSEWLMEHYGISDFRELTINQIRENYGRKRTNQPC